MSCKRFKTNTFNGISTQHTIGEMEISSKDHIFINNTNDSNEKHFNDNNNSFVTNKNIINGNGTDPSLNYCPKLFLRCHCKDNDPFDNSTQIWNASFQPKTKTSDGSRFVATCGANMVCIIDCEKAFESSGKTVIARYIDNDKDEELASLAWSVVESKDGHNGDATILAVGGKRDILLLSTTNFRCYERIRGAHSDQINALLFSENNMLFSASYDRAIKLWKISLPDDEISISELVTSVTTRNELLSMSYSSKWNTIIASGHQGVILWSNVLDKEESDLGFIKTNKLVDGLHILEEDEDSIAIRTHADKSTSIAIIDVNKAIDEMKLCSKKTKIKTILITKVQKAKLKSFDFEYPYIYLSAQKDLLVSGGPDGKMWLYKTDKFNHYYGNKVVGEPDRVIEWPAIENIWTDNKKVIDDDKFVIINTVAISPDLKYIIACTNVNLICIWHLLNPK